MISATVFKNGIKKSAIKEATLSIQKDAVSTLF